MEKYLRKMAICLTLGLVEAGASAAVHPSNASGNAHVERLSWRRKGH